MKKIYKSILICIVLVLSYSATTNAQTIVSYSYWFDNNIEGAITLAVTPEETIDLMMTANTSSLSLGYHAFHYRFKDNTGIYSVPVSRYFVLTSSDLFTYEYWFNGDIAQAVSVSITPEQFFDEVIAANTDALGNGYHTFVYRFRDELGNYSVPIARHFVRTSFDLTTYEYWFDTAIDERISTNISATQFSDVALLLDAASLNAGVHNVVMRWRDEQNNWSVPLVHQFSVIVGVDEMNMTGNILLFPNPADSQLSIRFELSSPTEITTQIFDELGKAVSESITVGAIGKVYQQMNIQSLASGVYFLKITSGETSSQLRFVKN